jgi:hypothetical protein
MTLKIREYGLEEIVSRYEPMGDVRAESAPIQLVDNGAAKLRVSQPGSPVITTILSRRPITPSIARAT